MRRIIAYSEYNSPQPPLACATSASTRKTSSIQACLPASSSIGIGLPYHVEYFPGGSYSYVDSKEQLGLELSINNQSEYGALFQGLLDGSHTLLDEMLS